MRRGIGRSDGVVPPFSNDFSIRNNHCADGYFSLIFGAPRKLERAAHEAFIIHSHSIVAGGLEEMS